MDWLWASRWICTPSRLDGILLGLLRETPDELNVDVPEMCRRKANPFLVPLYLLWRAALAFVSETWLISCHAVTFSFHLSVKACTQLLETNLILILFQHSPCSAWYSLTLFMPCLTFHRKHIFLFEKKNAYLCFCALLLLWARSASASTLAPAGATEHSWKNPRVWLPAALWFL